MKILFSLAVINILLALLFYLLSNMPMATLPDRLWRRVVELFLLAGRYYRDGQLPDTNELAWSLRMTMDDLDMDLKQIAQTGIINKTETGWLVVNFAKRQEKMTSAEKMRLSRKQLQRDQYYGDDDNKCDLNVTDQLLKVTQITDNRYRSDTDIDKETDAVSFRSSICDLYSQYIGVITPLLKETLVRADGEYPAEWFPKAFEIMRGNDKKSWAYVEGILKNWQANGYKPAKGKSIDRVSVEARSHYGDIPQ
jgi:DnaD/phage-associated family protein